MAQHIDTIYTGRVITLNLERVTLPNGHETELEIVHHPGGVAIVAQDQQQRLCLLRQYRHAAGGWLLELPAGKIEPDEPPSVTAERELAEEAGVYAEVLEPIGRTISSPGVFTEVIHLFFARELTLTGHAHEDGEVIEVHWIDLPRVREMISAGQIYDAKTLAGIFLAQEIMTDSD